MGLGFVWLLRLPVTVDISPRANQPFASPGRFCHSWQDLLGDLGPLQAVQLRFDKSPRLPEPGDVVTNVDPPLRPAAVLSVCFTRIASRRKEGAANVDRHHALFLLKEMRKLFEPLFHVQTFARGSASSAAHQPSSLT
jgi:hypothetical protein